jgi:endonuclease/exonuclease/phosphatase family metal-dependent hydrolase
MTRHNHTFRLPRWQFLLTAALLAVAQTTATAQPRPAPKNILRVLTYNIRYDNPADGADAWSRRRDAMGKFIADEKIDIAGLQEVLIHQARDLEERLPDYAWYGLGRDDGKTQGELSPVFYRQDRFERLGAGTFWLSTTPDKVGSKGWDAALPRVCSWLKLRDKTSGSEFFIFNTHFDHRGELARQLSATLLRVKLPEIAGESPLVLTGDFNATSSETAYKVLTTGKTTAGTVVGEPLEDARNASAAKAEGPDSTWNGFREIVPGRKIDFIFFRQAAVHSHRVLDPRVTDRFLSDHLPVVTEITISVAKK